MPHLMNTYNRLPVAFTHGEGAWLYDTNGKRYLDALAGIAVNTLGHAHPKLSQALSHQAGQLIHTSNLYRVPQQETLSDKLAEISGLDEVFFCNSGCEANEAAIKLARLFGHSKGVDQPAIVVMEKAFHGRTLATLSATGSRKVQAGFEPLVSGFARVPYNDFAAVKQLAANNKNVVAVMLESIQGEGGINIADHDYLRALRRLCDERDWLLILDAVQCGMGRTGKWFGHLHAGIQVDVLTLAKGLGSGVPIGACIAGGKATGTFKPGNHGSTFGGNPFACTAGLTTIRTIEEDDLMNHAARIGDAIRKGFLDSLASTAGVVDIRGVGLMIGIELDRPCGDLVRHALEAGLLINVTNDKVVRLLPPLIFSDQQVGLLVDGLTTLINRFLRA